MLDKLVIIRRREQLLNIILCVFGTFLYCVAVNIFIIPMNLYSGGFLGIAQLIVYALPKVSYINLQGIIYFVLNIPLFLMGEKVLGKKFMMLTVLMILEESVLLSMIPILKDPLIDDMLTNCLVGGGISGLGCGLTFLGFGSGGGSDILGMIISKKSATLSVGMVGLLINVVLYAICAYLFSFEVAVYSAITSMISSLVIDKIHLQNKNIEINIMSSKTMEISDMIINKLNRSTTILYGIGGFTGDNQSMIVTVMSEYESNICMKEIYKIDPDAFIFTSSDIKVIGNYEKRLNEN